MKPQLAIIELARRLENEYQEPIADIGGGFSVWHNSTVIGVEILFGRSGGPMWQASVTYAAADGWLQGKHVTRSWESVEKELREKTDIWIRERASGQ